MTSMKNLLHSQKTSTGTTDKKKKKYLALCFDWEIVSFHTYENTHTSNIPQPIWNIRSRPKLKKSVKDEFRSRIEVLQPSSGITILNPISGSTQDCTPFPIKPTRKRECFRKRLQPYCSFIHYGQIESHQTNKPYSTSPHVIITHGRPQHVNIASLSSANIRFVIVRSWCCVSCRVVSCSCCVCTCTCTLRPTCSNDDCRNLRTAQRVVFRFVFCLQ